MRCDGTSNFLLGRNHWSDPWNLRGTVWIRLSTGKLCVEVDDGYEKCRYTIFHMIFNRYRRPGLPSFKLTENDLHGKLLCTLEVDESYAMLASSNLISPVFTLWTPRTFTLPSICSIPDDCADFKLKEFSTIPIRNHLTLSDIYFGPWRAVFGGYSVPIDVLPTRWSWVEYTENLDQNSYRLRMQVGLKEDGNANKWWLSQQNYVRTHLQNAISADEYLVFTTGISFNCTVKARWDSFTLRGTFMTDSLPFLKVYLFLFRPQVELVDGRITVMNPPNSEKYYWAFDPAGLDRLTHQTTEDIDLPTPEFSIELSGTDDRYCGLIRDIHAAKGFDPDSQEAAIAIGYPLVDIKDINKFARELTCESSTDSRDDEPEDGIYYSLGLC
ncbi:hypothetical protein C8J57DRAFT_179528 [Mycena rebaudengoi]|nr:hypothetical protein C8J57DRAFT_179528 [Mycena rebaudengoi]